MPCGEGFDDPIEETRRQEAVVIAITAADFPKVIARPIEFVALCNNDPGTFVIKSEMPFDRGGNFNCASGIGGRIMQNHNDRCVIHGALHRKHDHARVNSEAGTVSAMCPLFRSLIYVIYVKSAICVFKIRGSTI